MNKSHIIIDKFFTQAPKLRSEFDSAFANPHLTHPKRFVWDYWHVKDQYSHIRTPGWEYFSPALYRQLHERLVTWGREELGCHDISPPWLSYYVDGCRQEIHTDRPHGPWAFVFSLTNWQTRKFRGGETLLARPEILNYWNNLHKIPSMESDGAFKKFGHNFNRLTVFDPRIPHGVAEVRGVEDPLDARLVIHGWFVNPRPFLKGPLSTKATQEGVEQINHAIQSAHWISEGWDGYLALRLAISKTGRVTNWKVVRSTLRSVAKGPASSAQLNKMLIPIIAQTQFRPARAGSVLTLPLQFVIG